MVFKIKAEEDVFKENKDSRYNPVRRMVSKLLMNSLYGKMQEKKKDESQAFISNNADMHEFLNKNEWTDILKIEGKILVKGYKKTFKETVNKPVQLGAYILAYSRQIMTNYMDP